MINNGLDGITAREERLRRLQAGLGPIEPRGGKGPQALSPQAAQVLSGVRKSNVQQPTALPPRRASEVSDKAAELIAVVMRDMMHSS